MHLTVSLAEQYELTKRRSSRVTKVKRLAEGGFSEVFLARSTGGDDRMWALKRMVCQTPASKADAKAELKILKVPDGCTPSNRPSIFGISLPPPHPPHTRPKANSFSNLL